MRIIGYEDQRIGDLAFVYIRMQVGIERIELISKRRAQKLVEARILFTWIMRNHTGRRPASFAAIGEMLGSRDPSSIRYLDVKAGILRERNVGFISLCAGFADFERERRGEPV
jgi:hypothetical protein